MKYALYALGLGILVSCQNSSSNKPANTAAIPGLSGYTLEKVPGSNWQKATKTDPQGNLLEMGFIDASGQKTGAWTVYNPVNLFPQKIAHYENGKLHGIYLEFNEGGGVKLLAHYQNDQLHGPWAKYVFSRRLEQANYKNGKLDGEYRLFEIRDGSLQSSAEYKDGVQDGYYRTYSPDGRITTEYMYRDGKQVSGNTAGSK